MSLGPYPDFAWSISRHGTLRTCARRYFYDTYGSWNGWEDDAPLETRVAYRLKKLTNLDFAVGSAIHRRAYELTTMAQQGEQLSSVEALRDKTRMELKQLYCARAEAFRADPKNNPMLHGFYYGDGPETSASDRVKEKLKHCLANLRNLGLWERITDWEVGVPFVSDPARYPDPVVHVEGVPVYANPDVVLKEEDGGFTVVDWKTGQPRDDDAAQIAVYGLFVREQYGVPECRGRLEYLRDGSSREVEVTSDRLDEAAARICASLVEMSAFVADPEINRARPKADFPLAVSRWVCKGCNYFELCEPELRVGGPLPWE